MTLQWIPLDQLHPHPENSNRMPPRLMEKLKRHIQRTGLYEPLVVRPFHCELRNVDCGLNGNDSRPPAGDSPGANPQSAILNPQLRYQILNGHHRAEVLRQLGHTHARCDVWVVSDEDALLLLATLNRLEGRDDPAARAKLLAKLAGDRSPEDLARLLPEPADAVARLLKLTRPPPAPLAAGAAALAARPMTFFLSEEQHALVREALAEAGREPDTTTQLKPSRGGSPNPPRENGVCAAGTETRRAKLEAGREPGAGSPGASRADALERIALWYLEARNLR